MEKVDYSRVIDALKSRELEVKNESNSDSREESMFLREKITFKIKKGKGKLKWRSKTKNKSNKKWYNNGKLRHFKRDCFEWKKKQKK